MSKKERYSMTPFKILSDESGISCDSIKNDFDDYINELESNRIIDTPRVLGIDGIYLMNRYRTLFFDIEEQKPIELEAYRIKGLAKTYIKSLPQHNKKIEIVVMSMWEPYRKEVKEILPHVVIVIDKQYVVREINKVLDNISKSIQKESSKEEKKLIRKLQILLLSETKKLGMLEIKNIENMFQHFPSLKRPYLIKELFMQLYDQTSRSSAEKVYSEIKAVIQDYDELEDFKKVVKLMDDWYEEIFNYFDYSHINFSTENIYKMIDEVLISEKKSSFVILREKILCKH